MKMEALREFKLKKSMGKLKEKFIVVPIWKQYRELVPVGNWVFDKFNTYEEAENHIKKMLKDTVGSYMIMKVYGRLDSSYELKVNKLKDLPKNKYAVFAIGYSKLRYCGVLEGYDRKDIIDTLNNNLEDYNTRYTKVYLIKDGKIKNQTAVRRLFDKGYTIGTDNKPIYKVELEKVPLKDLR